MFGQILVDNLWGPPLSPLFSLTIRRTFVFLETELLQVCCATSFKCHSWKSRKVNHSLYYFTQSLASIILCCPHKNPVKLAHKETVAYKSHTHSKQSWDSNKCMFSPRVPTGERRHVACFLHPSFHHHKYLHISCHWF